MVERDGIARRLLRTSGQMRGPTFELKFGKAVGTARRHGFRGCLHLLYVIFLEPLVMKHFPLYVQARRHALEYQRRRTAAFGLARMRSRREEMLAVSASVAPRTDSLVDPDRLDRLRTAGGGAGEVVLADIDQDGFLCSRVGPLQGVPTVSRDRFAPRLRFDLTVIDIDGVLGVKKHFRGDVTAFIAELTAGHDLRRAGCRVPAILDVDLQGLTITFEYVPGPVLREELALQGAMLRDRDVAIDPSYRRLPPRKRHAKRIEEGKAVLERVLDAEAIERLFGELKKIHAAGYVLHDLKFGNVIFERSSREPYFIDFDRARAYPQLSRLAFRFLRDRDYEMFNAHFGTEKLTHERVRDWSGRRTERLGRLYAPIYIEGGFRFGEIWSTEVGHGRWRYILRDNLPSLSDARVLDLGANNGFNAIQMMRLGAREVVAVEANAEAVAQSGSVRELFEWADNRSYQLTYVHDSMARLPHLDLGTFDFVTALCSIYYLDDDEIATVVGHISEIAPTLVLQCNTDRHIRRSDPRTYHKASVEYAVGALQRNGFPLTRVVAPRDYSRPLVIGRRGR
jgi:2-polyprenyl-3-methyl-5-hydroxy-6-metoxy-1,4-benzoquinol methylase